jgi:hypothetical protein
MTIQPEDQFETPDARGNKGEWEPPAVTLVGSVKDLVLGGPKMSGGHDQDANRKTPSGIG